MTWGAILQGPARILVDVEHLEDTLGKVQHQHARHHRHASGERTGAKQRSSHEERWW